MSDSVCHSISQRIVDDTREVRPGDIYVLRQGAVPLTQTQALDLTQKAVQAGAFEIYADPAFDLSPGVPVRPVLAPHLHLRDIAESFYGRPPRSMKLVAVTGTNGKTTTTYLIESLARRLGLRTGVIGTISYRYPGYEENSLNTTPGTLKLYRLLHDMAAAGCELVAMEVSSHGIVQGRIDGLCFDAAVWTNLGTDHLDFHHTREAYARAKQRLFGHHLALSHDAGKSPVAVVNADDREVMAHVSDADPAKWGGAVRTFSIKGQPADLRIGRREWTNHTWRLNMTLDGHAYDVEFPLVGEFNLANMASAVAALQAVGCPPERLVQAIPQAGQVPGRMECVHRDPLVIVDFAHTPEALENALLTARQCTRASGKLGVVFGAGGDRDPSKRRVMGEIASKHADFIVVTSDNPRTEDPGKILDEITKGIPKDCPHEVYLDRTEAIHRALAMARAQDTVLIAGKGHEDYQILGTTKIHFDDREVVRNAYEEHA